MGSKERSPLPLVRAIPGMIRHMPSQRDCCYPVGVWNGVNWDHGLGHGHPTDLGIVIAHTGEDGRQYLPGLIGSDRLAEQGGKGGM